ncbi:uncharacterized protein METZ01_LOCUS483348, partial [marine metagenome]
MSVTIERDEMLEKNLENRDSLVEDLK